MKTLTGWIVAYLARWLPHRAPTGLVAVGSPDEHAPVLVTANFTLTVKRVRRALEGRNVWLLVVPTEGINVWCAAAGKIFTHHRVMDAVKVSRLAERVRHRTLILPPLAAPGVDRHALEKEAGFQVRFGPVYARDLPDYLDAGGGKTEPMRRFDFGWRHRLDMFLPMNLPVWAPAAVVLALVAPRLLLPFSFLFWGAVALLYVLLDVLPGRTGWEQALFAALVVSLAWWALDLRASGALTPHWGRWAGTFAVFFAAGFDIAGTLSPRTSDAERMMQRLGFRSFGSVFTEKAFGRVQLDPDRCTGCLECWDLCPVGVYRGLGGDGKVQFEDAEACFACGACVTQCPEGALTLGE